MKNVKALSTAATKAAIAAGSDREKGTAIQALLKDYVSIFEM